VHPKSNSDDSIRKFHQNDNEIDEKRKKDV
jgi:hypothetical protein